jgi:hypothetical protein
MDNAVGTSSSNSTLSLLQSSTSSFDHIDNTYTIEDPESFRNSKGDIAD